MDSSIVWQALYEKTGVDIEPILKEYLPWTFVAAPKTTLANYFENWKPVYKIKFTDLFGTLGIFPRKLTMLV